MVRWIRAGRRSRWDGSFEDVLDAKAHGLIEAELLVKLVATEEARSCFIEQEAERRLPCGVRGPVDRLALDRLRVWGLVFHRSHSSKRKERLNVGEGTEVRKIWCFWPKDF